MRKLRVHVLFEHGEDLRPYGGSYLRLLRPLTHPLVKGELAVTYSRYLPSHPVDVIIVDRLWRSYDVSQESAKDLIRKSSNLCSKLFYAFDDNFELWVKHVNVKSKHYGDVFDVFLEACDGILVTSKSLIEAFSKKQSNAVLIPNMLDERLLVPKVIDNRNAKLIRIGYMGTKTHNRDLQIVLPAFHQLYKQYGDELSFEFIGILTRDELGKYPELSGLPVHIISPRPNEIEYPLFMLWYTQHISWDIAVAPLEDSSFNSYKSDVKVLDYAAIGAAGVYSYCASYKDTVNNKENGLIVDNNPEDWVGAVSLLIENKELRNQIQLNGYNYLYKERILAKTARLWVDGLYRLMEQG
jgi:processive 1,2-diacylglycerol beta-glucosyltransferase